jgi:hypothetical protein
MKRTVLISRLTVLLAACGTPAPDIPQPDGPFVPGPVSIKVTSRGEPAVNVPVIFQNASSDVVASTVTDFDGAASAVLEGNGFVTVIEPREVSAPRTILSTFAGVQGNDELHLDLAPRAPTEVAEFELFIEPDSMVDALGGHRVFSPCGLIESFALVGSPDPPPKAQLIGCGSTADILVVSLDELGQPLRSHFHAAVPLSGTQTLMGAYVDALDVMVDYRNIPAEIGFVGVYRAFARDQGIVFDVTAGVTSNAGNGMAPLRVPVMSGMTSVVASSTFPGPEEVGTQVVTDWDDNGGDYLLDLGAALLPRYITAPVFDVDRRTLTWEEAPGETEPDAVRVRLQVHRAAIPEGTAWEWRLIGPRTGTALTFPALPRDDRSGFNFNPILHDAIGVHELTTAKVPGGFDSTLRSQGFIRFADLRSGPSGRIVTQDLNEPDPIPEPE